MKYRLGALRREAYEVMERAVFQAGCEAAIRSAYEASRRKPFEAVYENARRAATVAADEVRDDISYEVGFILGQRIVKFCRGETLSSYREDYAAVLRK